MRFVVFTDESKLTASRFRSLSAFSMYRLCWKEAEEGISKILKDSGIKEFKWKKLKSAQYYFCAEKFINFIFENLEKFKIRIDTILWDTQDARHKVFGRNDIENFERMFFHLLKNSMKKRPKNAKWDIRPDQLGGIDWETIQDCLTAIGNKKEFTKNIFGDFFSDPDYKIESFKEKDSKIEKSIQIADLFAGMATFSRENFQVLGKWKEKQKPSLFEQEESQLSNSEKYRCKIIDFFYHECKSKKIGVSLHSKKCLNTFDPKKPINFWNYEPQHEFDKAPARGE